MIPVWWGVWSLCSSPDYFWRSFSPIFVSKWRILCRRSPNERQAPRESPFIDAHWHPYFVS